MERFKRFLKKAFCLPPLLAVGLAVPLFALLIFAFSVNVPQALEYLIYLGSAYALVISVTAAPKIFKDLRRGILEHPLKREIEGTKLGGRYLRDIAFRTRISLCFSFAVNLAYIVLKLYSGICYQSTWFIALAVYYALLALMRLLLLWCMGRRADMDLEWRRYRLCGGILLLMNQALAGIVIFIVRQNRGFDYPGYLIYAMAFYSFYAMITATVNVVKYRRHGRPVLSAAKAVNLVAAMVSILSLTTAMLARFGSEEDPAFRRNMTAAVGGGVCTVVIGMAVLMICRSTRQLRRLNTNWEKTDAKGVKPHGRKD